ncbi:MAG: hypothetical protein H6741_29245 [Alphaproteobacteria bacterium]|nr:hypothetical protein [Alphaproteobacteria bacterium]MCB9796806.1 hypothetical protein [Alphaproteobacteria bacterium]
MLDLYAMYICLGGRPWRRSELEAELAHFARRQRLEAVETLRREEAGLELIFVEDEEGWGWIDLLSRGEDALDWSLRLGRHLASAAGRPLRLYASGAGPGSGQHTLLAGGCLRFAPDGSAERRPSPRAEAYVADRNPVPDDCPHAEFHELMLLLLDGQREGEGWEESDPLALRATPLDEDPRVDRALRRALECAEVRLGEGPDGRRTLSLRGPSGSQETVFLSPEEARRVQAFLISAQGL